MQLELFVAKGFLVKAKHCCFKDMLLGKFSITMVDKEIDELKNFGKH
jgi:hypothetical protein